MENKTFKVKCIENSFASEHLKIGKIYNAEEFNEGYFKVFLESGDDMKFNKSRFSIIRDDVKEVGSFLVFVEGKQFPKVKHTYENAKLEAERLCKKEKRSVYIITDCGHYEYKPEFIYNI